MKKIYLFVMLLVVGTITLGTSTTAFAASVAPNLAAVPASSETTLQAPAQETTFPDYVSSDVTTWKNARDIVFFQKDSSLWTEQFETILDQDDQIMNWESSSKEAGMTTLLFGTENGKSGGFKFSYYKNGNLKTVRKIYEGQTYARLAFYKNGQIKSSVVHDDNDYATVRTKKYLKDGNICLRSIREDNVLKFEQTYAYEYLSSGQIIGMYITTTWIKINDGLLEPVEITDYISIKA